MSSVLISMTTTTRLGGPNAKDVDGPALTEFRECDLDLEDLPTWLSELAGGHPDQNRVTLIEQPIDLPAAP